MREGGKEGRREGGKSEIGVRCVEKSKIRRQKRKEVWKKVEVGIYVPYWLQPSVITSLL